MKVLYTPQEYLSVVEDRPAVLFFTASWCHLCQLIKPKVEDLESLYPQVVFAVIDVEDAVELADSFSVTQLPSVVLVKDCAEVHRITSFTHKRPTRAVSQAIRQCLLE